MKSTSKRQVRLRKYQLILCCASSSSVLKENLYKKVRKAGIVSALVLSSQISIVCKTAFFSTLVFKILFYILQKNDLMILKEYYSL